MDEVVPPDSEAITISGSDPDAEVWTGSLHPRSDRCCTTMDRMEAIGIHVVGQAGGASDTRDDRSLLRRDT